MLTQVLSNKWNVRLVFTLKLLRRPLSPSSCCQAGRSAGHYRSAKSGLNGCQVVRRKNLALSVKWPVNGILIHLLSSRMATLMAVLMEAIHSLYDQSHGHTFSATLKLLIGSRTPTNAATCLHLYRPHVCTWDQTGGADKGQIALSGQRQYWMCKICTVIKFVPKHKLKTLN